MAVVLETTVGDMTIDLLCEQRPRACLNFLKLCKRKYYHFNLVYYVQQNFIAQMGDPTATGRGGESVFSTIYGEQARYFEGEKTPLIRHTKFGTVSLVSCGDNLYGSQFFITLGEHLDSLDGKHLVIGHVAEGIDVLNVLNDTLTDDDNRPYQNIMITHTVVLHDPFPDPPGLEPPERSPSPSEAVLESKYLAPHESLVTEKDEEEMKEEVAQKEAETRATILEMVGDIPEADMAPPENVLFVCKLNPVTTSEDLEIIFSRFGKIVSCEVIMDKVTERSLQYAFVEFADQKSCENAYFKMDNVLIDERRIHVDFSQSVAKLKWKGKGRGVEHFDERGRKIDEREVRNKGFDYKNHRRDDRRVERNDGGRSRKDFSEERSRNYIELDRRREREVNGRSSRRDIDDRKRRDSHENKSQSRHSEKDRRRSCNSSAGSEEEERVERKNLKNHNIEKRSSYERVWRKDDERGESRDYERSHRRNEEHMLNRDRRKGYLDENDGRRYDRKKGEHSRREEDYEEQRHRKREDRTLSTEAKEGDGRHRRKHEYRDKHSSSRRERHERDDKKKRVHSSSSSSNASSGSSSSSESSSEDEEQLMRKLKKELKRSKKKKKEKKKKKKKR